MNEIPQNSPFDYPEKWSTLPYLDRKRLSNDQIWLYEDDLPAVVDSKDINYISNLPEYEIKDIGNQRIMLKSHKPLR